MWGIERPGTRTLVSTSRASRMSLHCNLPLVRRRCPLRPYGRSDCLASFGAHAVTHALSLSHLHADPQLFPLRCLFLQGGLGQWILSQPA